MASDEVLIFQRSVSPAYCPCNKPTRDFGRTQEMLVNHELQASDLQVFLVFSQVGL